MPQTIPLKPVHNALLDVLLERINRYQVEFNNHLGVILEDLGVPKGLRFDPQQIIATRRVILPDQPVTRVKQPAEPPSQTVENDGAAHSG